MSVKIVTMFLIVITIVHCSYTCPHTYFSAEHICNTTGCINGDIRQVELFAKWAEKKRQLNYGEGISQNYFFTPGESGWHVDGPDCVSDTYIKVYYCYKKERITGPGERAWKCKLRGERIVRHYKTNGDFDFLYLK